MSGVMVPPVSHNLKRLSGHSLAQIPGPFELPTRRNLCEGMPAEPLEVVRHGGHHDAQPQEAQRAFPRTDSWAVRVTDALSLEYQTPATVS